MNKVVGLLNCPHMIPYRGSSSGPSARRIYGRSKDQESEPTVYDIYSSFAEFGALAQVYNGHKLTPEKHVPEHFSPYLLSQVTGALMALQTGICASPNSEHRDRSHESSIGSGEDIDSDLTSKVRQRIVHSGIKDTNMFLRFNNAKYPDYDMAFDHDDEQEMRNRIVHGTPGLMHPTPDDWPVSEESDIWSLAMTAWGLMMAHKGENVYENAQKRSENAEHVDDLKNNTAKSKDGALPETLEELPKEYSVRRCQAISRCLRYTSKHRISLEALQNVINDNLSRLDRMYGDEVRKQSDAIADEFKLEYTTEDSDECARHAIGQKFEPPRKRRKIDGASAYEENLISLVTD
ncbi:NIMA-related kinase 2 [Alternaria panax]|uniref:NIMA-related kinase 2 n=1 Tax=Alternaria panax TaxID=48097 RepID=A0AAD4FA09_9PLEO|nr:NIMA-related kinase 2 [Alternaria panax]